MIENAGQNLTNAQLKQLKDGFQLAQQMIYDERVFGAMMADFQKAPPEQALAQSLVMVMNKVQEQVGDLDMLTATTMGIALLGDVSDALVQIGIEVTEEQQTAAFEVAVQLWLSSNAGKYKQEDVEAALGQMQGDPGQQPAQPGPQPGLVAPQQGPM